MLEMEASVNAVASSSKLPKTKNKHKSDKSSKGKGKGSKHDAAVVNGANEKQSSKKSIAEKGNGPYEHRKMRMRLSVPPRFSGDYMVGVKEQLDAMVMRYVSQVDGILLAHWEHSYLDETASLINECPFGVVDVQFETLVWAPKLGQKLYGTHSLSSPSHLSLLFSNTFNVSIPLQHIPQDLYEFHPTDPDEEDDEDEDSDSEDGFTGLNGLNGHGQVEEVGRWKLRSTGGLVGQGGKGIKFTVIGLQVTNQMLSITGSLLSDPSNPPPAPEAPAPTTQIQDSPTPEPEQETPHRPVKKARVAKETLKSSQSTPHHSQAAPSAAQEEPKEEVDESMLTARELKKKRKDEAKAKNALRKERKAGQGNHEQDTEEDAAVPIPVPGSAQEAGKKRKGGDDEGGKKKKKKKD